MQHLIRRGYHLRALVAVLFATLTGHAARAAEKGSPRPQTFQYYDYRIDLEVPPGWAVQPRKDHFHDINLWPARGGGTISIAYYQPLRERGFDDFKAWVRTHHKRGRGSGKLRFRSIKGRPAVTVVDVTDGQQSIETIETDIGVKGSEANGDVLVVFLDHFDRSTSPSTPIDYEAVVRSLKITPSPAPTGPNVPVVP